MAQHTFGYIDSKISGQKLIVKERPLLYIMDI